MARRPLKTVNRIIQAYMDDKRRIKGTPHPRRPRARTAEDDQHIVAVISLDPFQSARHINEAFDLDVSEMTIRRRFAEAGSKSRMSAQKPLLTDTNKAQRYRFAQDHQEWTVDQWRTVVFSDESTFTTMWDQRLRVWRPDCHRIEGSLTSQIYCEVIDYVMLPYVLDGPFPDGDFTYQHDLSPVHTSGMVRRLLEERCAIELPWPPKGADLNIIENVWGCMEAAMARRPLHRATADELWRFVLEEWEKLRNERNFVSALFSSLPSRMRAVVDARGEVTSY
ncbi:putative transposable element tc1 transposase [Ixodes scapularis]